MEKTRKIRVIEDLRKIEEIFNNQLGPGIEGKGNVALYTDGRSAKILFSPTDESLSKVLYGINGHDPDTPLPIREWIEISDTTNIYINYDVKPGGDIKICWSIV